MESPIERLHTETREMAHAATDVDRLANRLRSLPEEREDSLDFMRFLGIEALYVRSRQPLNALVPRQLCQPMKREQERMQRLRRGTWKLSIIQHPLALLIE
ncbi:V-type ATP synthase subunit I, putative [Stigmatella aurantiaca DW4/3-1]|uniref:V-type ATP synthase subunit I, putative n=1 Tax=Stigmatella aurantiaca (strain DW4/3-1) TaxID=378806 RepID=Q08UB8_STIAD|nr:V-type ATP synthase subunit I, putative [Stigmatella aurantiaca DW4/3-1]